MLAILHRESLAVGVHLEQGHIHIAYVAENARQAAQAVVDGVSQGRAQVGPHQAQRRPEAASGNAHGVQFLDVLTQAGTGLVVQHALIVKGQNLVGGNRHPIPAVQAEDIRRPGERECLSILRGPHRGPLQPDVGDHAPQV